MADRLDQLRMLIAANPSVVEFADFGDGIDPQWIQKAESTLGVQLPPSYTWWLTSYSGGEIGGEEIFSIYMQDFDSVVGGDIVYMHRLNQKNGLLGKQEISICESELDGIFYFDFAQQSASGECPILARATGEIYASDFAEFLTKRIETAKG